MIKCEPEDASATCTLSLSDTVSVPGMQSCKCSHCEKCYSSATDLCHHDEKHFEKEQLKGIAIAVLVTRILGHHVCYNDTNLHKLGELLTNAQCVTSVLAVYRIYSGIKDCTQGRSCISAVIVLNVLVISQTYRDINGCILGENLSNVQSVTCVLVSYGIWSSTRKHTLTRVQTVLMNIKATMWKLFMRSHWNAQNAIRVFSVQQTFKAMKGPTVVKHRIPVLSMINASLVCPMFTDTWGHTLVKSPTSAVSVTSLFTILLVYKNIKERTVATNLTSVTRVQRVLHDQEVFTEGHIRTRHMTWDTIWSLSNSVCLHLSWW